MSKQDVVNLFKAASEDSDLLQKFNVRSLEELLFHAKNLGYNFSREELADVIGSMEATLILQKMGEKIDGRSSLWPKMWAKYHFHYIIEDVFLKFSEQELKQFV